MAELDIGVAPLRVQYSPSSSQIQLPEKAGALSQNKISIMDFAPLSVNDASPAITSLLETSALSAVYGAAEDYTRYVFYFPDSDPPNWEDIFMKPISVEVLCPGKFTKMIFIDPVKYPCLVSCSALVTYPNPRLDLDVIARTLLEAGCAQKDACPPFPQILPDGGELILYRPGIVPEQKNGTSSVSQACQGHSQPTDQVQHISSPPLTFGYQSIGQSPMSNFASPASFMTASSPASYMTARSAYASPAFSMAHGPSPGMRIPTIREDEPPDPSLSEPLQKIHNDYFQTLHRQNIIQPFDQELNWSGKGQHVTFKPRDPIPLTRLSHLGSSMTATVDKVLCRRIAIARKTMRCSHRWTVADALREVYHLQNLRHHHIIQLVGTYLQGRNFSILMYPVADCHLGTFLEDTSDSETGAGYSPRIRFLASSLSCLSCAVAYIHTHTTKHMDIKPQNILIRETRRDIWRIYLADFGLSRSFALQDHSQTDGPTSRTPRYCSPEVYNYEQRGRSSDIFSLGCVFLEILTVYAGKSLQEFTDDRRGGGDDESFHANLKSVTNWINELHIYSRDHFGESSLLEARFIPPNLLDIVARMMNQQPDQRPSASELAIFFASLIGYEEYREPFFDNEPEMEIEKFWTKSREFRLRSCCTLPPEPYEVDNSISF